MGVTREKDFWIATAILIVTVSVMAAIILHWIRFGFFVGPFRLNHWFVLIGATYIASVVPIIAFLKKRFPKRYTTLYRIHVFGNLSAFMLISLHFASQISRPANSYPELGTGIVLYTAMILLVSTGFMQRFHLVARIKLQSWRFVHMGVAVAFYLTIIVHILRGLSII